MKASELKQLLKNVPDEAEIFYGNRHLDEPEGLPAFELYEIEEAHFHKRAISSVEGSSRHFYRDNIFVLESY